MWTRHGQRDTLRVLARTARYPSNRDAVNVTSVTTRGVRRNVASTVVLRSRQRSRSKTTNAAVLHASRVVRSRQRSRSKATANGRIKSLVQYP
ncbi:hypothetical protein NDU88_006980 [Pleurodeles waltl]|uniref:Uncharacterized protein n=1 Tax=Pleurodeles waltl TaxID=8319 RepID=A0AAV7LQQ2_PLEWA|nr:hypothetical protein NDU88_006980 [Pleurodeles waltl]